MGGDLFFIYLTKSHHVLFILSLIDFFSNLSKIKHTIAKYFDIIIVLYSTFTSTYSCPFLYVCLIPRHMIITT